MAPPSVTGGTGLVPTVGLEIHARLSTRTKLFCACRNVYGDEANTHVCPVCLGLPGSLPVLNREAVNLAVDTGLALGCDIAATSAFDRKNYFYPDLPRNYQITQYRQPLCRGGRLDLETGECVRLERIHLEEDAGRLLGGAGDTLQVDLNRAGTPLVEIVTRPDLGSGEEAARWLRRLRQLLLFVGVCDGNLAEGSLRCDANVGFGPATERAADADLIGPWSEIKNLNSFRAVAGAVDHEIERLGGRLAAGLPLRHETRAWNDHTTATEFLRSKETSADYRYFPEPDLPVLVVALEVCRARGRAQPELPLARESRFVEDFGLSAETAATLCQRKEFADYFEHVLKFFRSAPGATGDQLGSRAVLAGNWIRSEVLGRLDGDAHMMYDLPVTPERLADLLRLVHEGAISGRAAKQIYARLVTDPLGPTPQDLVSELDLAMVGDEDSIAQWCAQAITSHPDEVATYRHGKTGLLDFLVGQVMLSSAGRADPRRVRTTLQRLLTEGDCDF